MGYDLGASFGHLRETENFKCSIGLKNYWEILSSGLERQPTAKQVADGTFQVRQSNHHLAYCVYRS